MFVCSIYIYDKSERLLFDFINNKKVSIPTDVLVRKLSSTEVEQQGE